MTKKVTNASKRTLSLTIILNLLLSIFAFTFIIYNASEVSAQENPNPTLPPKNKAIESQNQYYEVPEDMKFQGHEVESMYQEPGANQMTFNYRDANGDLQSLQGGTIGDGKLTVTEVTTNPDGSTTTGQVRGLPLKGIKGPDQQSYNDNALSIDFGTGSTAFLANNILKGFQYSLLIVGGIQLIGGLFGLDSALTSALSLGAFSGMMAGELAKSFLVGPDAILGNYASQANTWTHGTNLYDLSGLIGIGVGILVFMMSYSSSDTETVSFQCNVWQPPRRGEDCEKCNLDNKNFPCTEYKCKSLGAGCELKNPGTGEELCTWVDPRDVTSPIIDANYANISEGYRYENVHIRPPGIGMEVKNTNITNNENGCVEAFFPLQFGITTNEPTQCKIDYNHTTSFDEMKYYFGGSTTFKYNHTQTLALPGPSNLNKEFPELKNDGVYNLFVRCQDASGNGNEQGNVNEDEFAIKFCVNPGPDTTPPRIETTSLLNGAPVSYGAEKVNITLYTNEPSDCKWSKEDKDYGVMENTMSCSRSITEFNSNLLYACSGKLAGVEDRKNNDFYFRCKDQPLAEESERNENTESYKFTIKGTQPLNILSVGPNGTIQGSTSIVSVNIGVETANGYQDGNSVCYYSRTGEERTYVKFFETGNFIHKQRQDLSRGEYTYYIKCVDLGGNADYNKTKFKIEIDEKAPRVVRVKHDSGESTICGAAGCLRVTTDEESTCSYSTTTCNFEINNGIKMPYENTKDHYTEWKTDFNYYIKCADKSGNQPGPTQCSMIVKGYNSK